MIKPAIFSGLCLLWLSTGAAVSASLVFTAPGAGPGPVITLYSATDPRGLPVATVQVNEAVTLNAGRYTYGLESYDWRGASIELAADETKSIALAGLLVEAPEGSNAQFSVFDAEESRLTYTFGLPESGLPAQIFLPPGRYLLRRDLATGALPVSLEAGETSHLTLGSIALRGPVVPFGQVAYVAPADSAEISATLVPGIIQYALQPGNYLVAAAGSGPPVEFSVRAGEITWVPHSVVHWTDQAVEGEAVTLRVNGRRIPLPTADAAQVMVFGASEAQVETEQNADVGLIEFSVEGLTPLWRFNDSTLPLFESLPLEISENVQPIVKPGAVLELRTQVAAEAELQVLLIQGGETHDLGIHRIYQGQPVANVMIPDTIKTDQPVHFEIFGPTDAGPAAMRGQTSDYPVHVPLVAPVTGLSARATGTTMIELIWDAPSEETAIGVQLFRDHDERPVNGRVPVATQKFTDLGLSAGREYRYQVCVVDALGISGPCSEVSAVTQVAP